MSIQFVTTLDGIDAGRLKGFFDGWPKPPTLEKHLHMLRGSSHIVLAIDDETGNVIGFINAISDGCHFAFTPLLEVLPDYRGRGIGSELVKRLLDQLRDYYAIDLRCDEPLQAFYEPLGFSRAIGMMRRNYDRQASGTDQ